MKTNTKNMLLFLLAAVLGAFIGCYILVHMYPGKIMPVTVAEPGNQTVNSNIYNKTDNPIVEVVKKVGPSVVNITTETQVKVQPFGREFNEFFKFFGEETPYNNAPQNRVQAGQGSGVIISADGYILTNDHVIHKAENITVTMSNGKKMTAKKIGSDSTLDLAVIKVDEKNLPFATLGDSDAAQVGEWVIAIGTPYGYENTVTVGVLSAKGRKLDEDVEGYTNLLQTDAAINRGNSGGPLIDITGKVIGINTAIIPYAQGIGFAIPINTIKKAKDDLVSGKKISRPYIGIYMEPMTEQYAQYLKMPKLEGVFVSGAIKGSPAEKAGLKRGDVILEVNGKKVNTPIELRNKIKDYKTGDTVTLKMWSDEKTKTVSVKLVELQSLEE